MTEHVKLRDSHCMLLPHLACVYTDNLLFRHASKKSVAMFWIFLFFLQSVAALVLT